jgi:hypothetical protein
MNLGRVREHRAALASFNNAYVAYLEASHPNSPRAPQQELSRLRGAAARLIPAAQAALNAANVDLTIYPPPAFGGPILRGLPNTAFAHEGRAGGAYGEVPPKVVEMLRVADGYLAEREKAIERRRRNPLFWGDLVLRTVLGFPAYLLSPILGVPFDRIDQSPWGTALRLVELGLAGLGTYFGGQAAGWW